MPKRHRLTRADIATASHSPRRRVPGDYFSLAVSSLPPSESAKTTCVVSKKVSTRASVRNLVKRCCREALRPRLPAIKKPVALVFHAKREAAEASFSELKRDVEALLSRI